mgnify:CR=1 FL=1
MIERPTPERSSEGRVTVLRLAPSGDTVARVRIEYDAVARDGESVRYDTEPGTSFWQRAGLRFTSILPIEWLL